MKHILFLIISNIYLLIFQTDVQATELKLSDPVSFSISEDRVTVKVNNLTNIGNNTSGTLFLKLYAMPDNDPYGSGYILAEGDLATFIGDSNNGPLAPGQSYSNISFTTQFSVPPDDNYYLFLHVFEYPNLTTSLTCAEADKNPLTFSSSDGDGEGKSVNNNNIELDCPCSFEYSNTSLFLEAKQINNHNNSGTSGTLKLKLWATPTPYSGGKLNGYLLGEVNLGQLSGSISYFAVDRTTNFTPPPDGTYYITLALTEYNGSDYLVDYMTFDDTRTFTGAPSINGSSSGFLSLNCPCGYKIDGSTLNLSAFEVLNSRNGGTSGTLKLKLWATSTPYTGGTISGYLLGEVNLGQLEGGHLFKNIQQTTKLRKPPGGVYFITIVLTEYNGQDFIVDYMPFTKTLTFFSDNTSTAIGGTNIDGGGGSFSLAILIMLLAQVIIKRKK